MYLTHSNNCDEIVDPYRYYRKKAAIVNKMKEAFENINFKVDEVRCNRRLVDLTGQVKIPVKDAALLLLFRYIVCYNMPKQKYTNKLSKERDVFIGNKYLNVIHPENVIGVFLCTVAYEALYITA